MKRIWAVTIVGALLVLFLPVKYALACSCVPPPGDREALVSTDVVFSGTVTGIDDPEGDKKMISSGRPVTYTFAVDAVAKGVVAANEQVGSAADSASCGFGFRDGRRYVVFADEDKKGDLTTSLCSNTHILKEGEDIDFVATRDPSGDGPVQGPLSEEGVPAIAWVGIAAILGLGAATFFLTRRRAA